MDPVLAPVKSDNKSNPGAKPPIQPDPEKDDPLKLLLPRKKTLDDVLKDASPEIKKLIAESGTPPLANTNDHVALGYKTKLTKEEAAEAIKRYGDSKPQTATIVAGDPKLGTIHVLKQVHISTQLMDAVDEGPTNKIAVGSYHGQMLKFLDSQEKGKVFIFEEGRAEPYGGKELKMFNERLTARFDPKKPLPESPGHKFELSVAGAGRVFHHYNPDRVELLAAEPVEPFAAVRKYGQQEMANGSLYLGMYLLHEVRENLTMNECAKFLKANPGKTVYLIYGTGHTWDENDLLGAKKTLGGTPALVETSWPGLVDRLPSRTVALLGNLDAAQQLELIKKAPGLDPMAFDKLASEEAQLLAVEKIVYGNPKQVEQFGKAYLHKHAKSDKVKEAIDARFPGKEIDLLKADPKTIKLLYGY